MRVKKIQPGTQKFPKVTRKMLRTMSEDEILDAYKSYAPLLRDPAFHEEIGCIIPSRNQISSEFDLSPYYGMAFHHVMTKAFEFINDDGIVGRQLSLDPLDIADTLMNPPEDIDFSFDRSILRVHVYLESVEDYTNRCGGTLVTSLKKFLSTVRTWL